MNKSIGERGSSLIEIIVGITLLAILLLPLFNIFAQNIRILKNIADRELAVFLAQRTMEEIKSFNTSEIEDRSLALTDQLNSNDYPELGISNSPIYERKVMVIENMGVLEIKVSISWQDGKQNYFLETKVADG